MNQLTRACLADDLAAARRHIRAASISLRYTDGNAFLAEVRPTAHRLAKAADCADQLALSAAEAARALRSAATLFPSKKARAAG